MHAQITTALSQQQSTVKEMESNVSDIHTLSGTTEGKNRKFSSASAGIAEAVKSLQRS